MVTNLSLQAPPDEKHNFLSTLLRSCILSSHAHCNDAAYPRITTVLCRQIRHLVSEMSTSTVRHLKDLIPLLTEVLTNPFGTACPAMLGAAADALKEVLLNAWMRVSRWRGEVIAGLIGCWIGILEDENEQDEMGGGGGGSGDGRDKYGGDGNNKQRNEGKPIGPRVMEIEEESDELEPERNSRMKGIYDDGEENVTLKDVKATLRGVARTLRSALEGEEGLDIDAEYKVLTARDERLEGLLGQGAGSI
ncbi:MAG: hypothetical protein M1837_001200 [Sclerophora amabilis]|nr:MAG: hypothetical protein M1837_001200 [Sclerophora amabilis]